MTDRGRGGDEHGLTLILFALSMTVIMTMAALVLDIAQLRTDRRVNKSVADTAVRAGLGLLPAGPWPGVCRARTYLQANSRFSSFDAGSERWYRLGSPVSTLASSPCGSTGTAPYTTACLSAQPSTWGRLTATAGGGRYAIEIQSGYAMPDSRFPEDAVASYDSGEPCDNLVVVIREARSPVFGGIVDRSDKTTTIRSVGRQSQGTTGSGGPALLLLEDHGCSVLVTGGSSSRVVAQAVGDQPGLIQIDSDRQSGCSQPVLNGQSSGGGTIIACSATTAGPSAGCNVATANKPSRIGINALNFQPTAGVTSAYPGSYGDTQAVAAQPSGRKAIDATYRANVTALDGDAKAVLTSPGSKPPGCGAVTANLCTDAGGATWLVLQQGDCNSVDAFFAASPSRPAAPQIWFNCSLSVGAPLSLTAASSFVVVTKELVVTSAFSITDPRKVYVGGKASGGGPIGLDIGNGGSFNVGKPTTTARCALMPSPMMRFSKLVVGAGAFKAASGGAVHLCGTAVFMANGYDKVPATDGTAPCTCTAAGYTGTVEIGSGAVIDWTAPNLVKDRRATPAELLPTGLSPFEDLALWTEAGGSTNTIGGGGSAEMGGVYFLGNADSFTLAGNAGANVSLSAQFISRTLKVTGGAVVNLVPDPFDIVPLTVPQRTLVR